ncbi:MAG: electron transfer flavoprotein subunit beta/FixA family protein [Bacteroidetes bacterium]|jgi:electron transfer flavoprotein beta subunit|nr:electron transfer flavoprotein subunit beta/FixA family protein [Bacteroidota bacterium]
MKLIACINHVPDTAAKINVAGDAKSIDKTGVTFVLNPYDEFALEECLRLKEKNGGEVIAVSLGTDAHKETLRKALAMGVDKAVLLKDDSPRDSFAVARALADYIKEQSPDAVFFGKQSVDSDDAAVGGMVAEMLGLPSASVVVRLEVTGTNAVAEREIEGGREKVQLTLPAVFTAQKGLNDPRYPSLKGIMAAKSKPIEERPATVCAPKTELVGMRKPPSKNPGKIVGTDVSAVPELVRLLREEAKVI